MSDDMDSVPGCIGYYNGKKADCKSCEYQKICKNVVSRKEVEKILEKVRELKEILAR